MYDNFARNDKHFTKRKHIYDHDGEAIIDDDAADVKLVVENLATKSNYTSCTIDNFLAWKMRFKAEMLMAKQKKPQWKIEQSYLSKPTGKQIFEKQRL